MSARIPAPVDESAGFQRLSVFRHMVAAGTAFPAAKQPEPGPEQRGVQV